MTGLSLGFDTSNYTTSVACFDGETGENYSRLLPVEQGQLGLRQSDALFHHVKALPALAQTLFAHHSAPVLAVGASLKPRPVPDSYMPCFLAGDTQGRVLAASHGVAFYETSHQEGHVAAAAFGAKAMFLLAEPHLGWHLSGGTTELLAVEPAGAGFAIRCVGGTTDLTAGQLIDRLGQRLQLPFPAGAALDALSLGAQKTSFYRLRVKDGYFSLSGMENKTMQLLAAGEAPAEVAAYVLRTIAYALREATRQVLKQRALCPVLFAGGVASNTLIRRELEGAFSAYFAPPALSGDNALGVAILTDRAHRRAVGG